MNTAITSTRRTGRRRLAALALGVAILPWSLVVQGARPRPRLTLWRDPDCGCCHLWAKHLEAHQFDVEVRNVSDADGLRRRLGLPPRLTSCHTATVEGYVIEGHVPTADILRLLRERPHALGLAVPGMAIGSPDMESGTRRDPYDVLLVHRDGGSSIFKTYR